MSPVRLVLSDVDGTLVDSTKRLTAASVDAVRRLRAAGIDFAVTSARPPRGLSMLVEPLELTTPLGAFNGGMIVDPGLAVLDRLTIRSDLVAPIVDTLASHGLSVWLYQGPEWYVTDPTGPHVATDSLAVQFAPTPVESFAGLTNEVVKVVGVSDDPALIARARHDLYFAFGEDVSATTSQSYYLDVTHCDATKGRVVDYLAERAGIDRDAIVVIGDGTNDVAMFERGGLSVAMGNADAAVKAAADHVAATNDDEGFADAVERYVLSRR